MAEENKKQKFKLDVKAQAPEFRAGIENMKNKADYGNRQNDTTIVNTDGANASVRLTDNKVNIAGSQDSGIKVNEQQSNFQSFEEKHVTNRFNLDTYEVIINGHKLNPNLWEYSDMSEFRDSYYTKHAVGGLCMFGSVLCPTWDEQLHKYVLVRRLARMPLFSSKLNVPEIMKALNIEDPTKVSYDYGYKQSTESADEFQKKAEEKLKTEADKKDGDAPEQGPNGRHLSEDDIKQTMDANKGMTREQAVEKLQKDSKYTRPWKEGEGYTDGKGHGELGMAGDAAAASGSGSGGSGESGDVSARVADLYDGDATDGAKGPNGRKYFENDIKYLMDNNKDMTREQAEEILSKDPKYTRKWRLGSGYLDDNNSSSGGGSSSSDDNTPKSPNGRPYATDDDIAWEVNELGKKFDKLDDNFKRTVVRAMVSQAKTYGTAVAATHAMQARAAVVVQHSEANAQYSQWLNDIAYYLGTIDYKKPDSSSSSSESVPTASAGSSSTTSETPKKSRKEKHHKKSTETTPSEAEIKHEPASTQSRTEPKATSPARDDASTFRNKPTPAQTDTSLDRVEARQRQLENDRQALNQKIKSAKDAARSKQEKILQKMLQTIRSYAPQSREEMLASTGIRNTLEGYLSDFYKEQGNVNVYACDLSTVQAPVKNIFDKLGLTAMNNELFEIPNSFQQQMREMRAAFDRAHGI